MPPTGEVPNSTVVKFYTSVSTVVYSNVTKLAEIVASIEIMQT